MAGHQERRRVRRARLLRTPSGMGSSAVLLLAAACASVPPRVQSPPVPDGPAALVGRVLTAEGDEPVAGARVETRDGPPRSATTGPDGSFRLDDLAPGAAEFRILSAAHATADARVRLAPGGETRHDFFVLPGTTLEGRVLLLGGTPVPSAVVEEVDGLKSAITGPDGSFLLRGLGGEPFEDTLLTVRLPGGQPLAESVDIPPGFARIRRDLVFQEPWTVAGRILYADRPVAGARVTTRGEWLEHSQVLPGATTGEDGAFVLQDSLWTGATNVFAWKEGLGVAVAWKVFNHPGRVVPVDLRLPGTRAVPGRATGPRGRAAGGARVVASWYLEPPSPYFPCPDVRAVADAEGRFVLALQPGTWRIEVRAAGLVERTVDGFEVPEAGEPPPLEVLLEEGATVAGRVVDDEGRPVAGAAVGDAKTGPDGRFVLHGLPPAGEFLDVVRTGFVGPISVVVAPGTDEPDIVLERASAVSGTVLLPDGRTPARTFRVWVWPDGGDRGVDRRYPNSWGRHEGHLPGSYVRGSFSGEDGRFEVEGLLPSVVALEAESGDLRSPLLRGVVLEPGRTVAGLRFVLGSSPRIAGSLRTPEGEPVRDEVVELTTPERYEGADGRSAGPPFRWVWTDSEGRFEFRCIGEGPHVLTGYSPYMRFYRWSRFVEVPSSGEVLADIVVPTGGHLAFVAVDPDGNPIGRARLEFLDGEGKPSPLEYIDGEGFQSLPVLRTMEDGEAGLVGQVRAGPCRARASADGFLDEEVLFEVREGEETALRVVLRPR